MATNPLQLKLEPAPNQRKRFITCKSKSASFKRVIVIHGNNVDYFSGTGLDTPMKLVSKETKITIPETNTTQYPIMVLFLTAETSFRGVPTAPLELLTVQEPVFHNMKMTHEIEIPCIHPVTKKLECVLDIEIPMS